MTPGRRPGPASSEPVVISAAFFGRGRYDQWLDWIEAAAGLDVGAAALSAWLDAEWAMLRATVAAAAAARPGGNGGLRMLDVGCGFGRHSVGLASSNELVQAVGIDINATLIDRATQAATDAGVADRVQFRVADAGALTPTMLGRFDLVVCMANALGNMPVEIAESFLAGASELFAPRGRLLLSVYSVASADLRAASYRAIGMSVAKRGSDVVSEQEGFCSRGYTVRDGVAMVERAGLLLDAPPITLGTVGVGLTARAREPASVLVPRV